MATTHTYQNAESWRGYWGSPAEAFVALGQDLMSEVVSRGVRIAEKVLTGEDISGLPVWPSSQPASAESDAQPRQSIRYSKRAADVDAWIKAREARK